MSAGEGQGLLGLRVDVDGTVAEVRLPWGSGRMAALYEATGSDMVQVLPLRLQGEALTMWMDEEGKIRGQVPNPVATAAVVRSGTACEICGPVVITGGGRGGNTFGLDAELAGRLTALLRGLPEMQDAAPHGR